MKVYRVKRKPTEKQSWESIPGMPGHDVATCKCRHCRMAKALHVVTPLYRGNPEEGRTEHLEDRDEENTF